MIRITLVATTLLAMSCGDDLTNQAPLRMSQEATNHFDGANGVYPMGYACSDTGSAQLSKMLNRAELPTLTLSFHNAAQSEKQRLSNNASQEQRCEEIAASILSNPAIDFNFDMLSDADESQAAGGAQIPIKPNWVALKYQDGTLNEHSVNVNLRCENEFKISCSPHEKGGCDGYVVHAPNEACTFRASTTLFEMSNHKNSVIDINGEIDFSVTTNPALKITSLSVVGES